jgi:hypothetical protein
MSIYAPNGEYYNDGQWYKNFDAFQEGKDPLEFIRAQHIAPEHAIRDPAKLAFSAEDESFMNQLLTDDKFYAEHILKIKTDDGIIPFTWNVVQKYINKKADDQKRRTGKVRQCMVKGRQQGGSEGIGSRLFKQATLEEAKNVYILTHETKATSKLFAKVERYYRYAPAGFVPGLRASNRNQMIFDNESEYTVGTAGSENTGRGDTTQLAHLSEPAHYNNDEEIKSGFLQTISGAKGTEIWWETTANGYNWFYLWVQQILAGNTEYELIFVPWCWSDKYALPVPDNFDPNEDELKVAELGTYWDEKKDEIYNRPLTNEQLFWRRTKIAELGERKFKQEYPLNLNEAFQASGDSFYDSTTIDACRKTNIPLSWVKEDPIILGVDAARDGDETVLAKRQGRKGFPLECYENMNEEWLYNILAKKLDTNEIDYVIADPAYSHGTIDFLVKGGYGDRVFAVNFASKADDPIYANKRAEMLYEVDTWMKDGPCQLPNDDKLAADMAAIPPDKPGKGGKKTFVSKEDIKKELKRSPDRLDAFMLTFGRRVRIRRSLLQQATAQQQAVPTSNSELSTLERMRGNLDVNPGTGGYSGSSVGRADNRGLRGH